MPFNILPDHSRLWLLALDTVPEPDTLHRLQHGIEEILAQWRHKGIAYQGAVTILENQILAVAEPSLSSAPSGCAIDGMLRKVDRLIAQLSLSVVDPAQAVLVRLGNSLAPIPKADLAQRLEDGTLTPSTPVLDLALFSLADLRAGKLESPLSATWIGRKFKDPSLPLH